MAAPCFITWNAATPTTGIQGAGVATGATTLVAMLQIKVGTPKLRIVEWGYSFSTTPTSAVTVDLVTSATGLTMTTATASADVLAYNDVTGPASQIAVGATTNSGFGAVAESGSATIRTLAKQYELGYQFKQQFPQGREPEVNGGQYVRIRMAGVSLTASMYLIWEE
jgi:hypothetical protein